MKQQVVNLENKKVGDIELLDVVFGLEPRGDILFRVVEWQRAKKRAGTHATKTIVGVSGTTRKPWAQKGTGRARQGSLRSPQFRKGGIIFGPVVRDHAHDLPKKFRSLGLRMAMSAKNKEGKLIILDDAKVASHKTKDLAEKLEKIGALRALVIDGANLDENFAKAARNLPHVDVLPEQGANVYDIMRHDILVLTKNAVEQLQARLNVIKKSA